MQNVDYVCLWFVLCKECKEAASYKSIVCIELMKVMILNYLEFVMYYQCPALCLYVCLWVCLYESLQSIFSYSVEPTASNALDIITFEKLKKKQKNRSLISSNYFFSLAFDHFIFFLKIPIDHCRVNIGKTKEDITITQIK